MKVEVEEQKRSRFLCPSDKFQMAIRVDASVGGWVRDRFRVGLFVT